MGMTIGAVLGGMIMKIGRRKAILISNFIGLIGLAITLVENFNVILVGRFVFGFSVGLKSVVSLIGRDISKKLFLITSSRL